MKIPPLPALRAFEAVARHGNVRRAAEELGLDHTVVSRHLRSLQELVDAQLVRTSRQGVVLTQAGSDYAARIRSALADIADATRDVSQEKRSASLTIGCLPGFALRWMTPRLPDFQRLHPEIDISLRPGDIKPDLADDTLDAQIGYGAPAAGDMRVAVLARPRVFPVASPFWLEKHPTLADDLGGLATAPLIHEESHEQWRVWFAAAGLTAPKELRGPKLWHAHLAVEAARLGQGVALANELICGADLASGGLVELGTSAVVMQPYVLFARPRRWNEPALARFRRWLVAQVRQDMGSTRKA